MKLPLSTQKTMENAVILVKYDQKLGITMI